MKKIATASFALIILLTSCDKNAIQQTTQTIKNADSLFQNVSRGYKTVDSISQIIHIDSAKIPPEIREKTEVIRKNINLKNLSIKNIDSVSAALKDISKRVEGGTDIAKTIDSAANAVKNSDDPLAAITAVTGAINKISKKNSTKITPPQVPREENSGGQIPDDPAFAEQPVIKTAEVIIIVDDLKSAKEKLRNALKNDGADIVSENFTDSEGTNRQNYTVKIPLKNFDTGLDDITQTLGTTAEKSVSTEGTDFRPQQMCDIKITLKENPSLVGKDVGAFPTAEPKTDENGGGESGFYKGLHGAQAVFAALLPFWPIFLIAGLIWYFLARSRRGKEEREILRQREYNEEMRRRIAEQTAQINSQKPNNEPFMPKEEKPRDPDDYSRFMPK